MILLLCSSEAGDSMVVLEEAVKFLSAARQLNQEMPLQQLLCLLIIAEQKEGMSLSEVAKKAGIGLATASRYVASLGKINRHREEGLNFVEAYENPMERRQKIIRLTTKGKIALKKMLGGEYADLSTR